VWSNHVGVEHYITGLLLQAGYRVVERARLQQIFDEQKIRLSHTPDTEADMLRVGRLVGASQVIFATVAMYDGQVTVRSVDVESGEVRWSGTASHPRLSELREVGTTHLAWLAISRATCRFENRYEWVDPSSSESGGCVQKP